MNVEFLKSPLRYPGGKSRAIKILKDFIPKDFSEYREPFFGGGSIGIYLWQDLNQTHSLYKQNTENVPFLANDLNRDLYCFWQVLKTQNKEMISEIQKIKTHYKNGKTLYEELKARRDGNLSKFQRAVDFFILNRITFSGVVDCGGYSAKAFETRFTQSSIDRLKNMDTILQNFVFSNESYETLLQKKGENVFIFLDPPYFSAKKSKLYGRNGDLHTNFNHEKLHEQLKNCPHNFLLTCDNSPYIRELYKDFFMQEYSLQYGMNNYKQQKANLGEEVLISNFPTKNMLCSA